VQRNSQVLSLREAFEQVAASAAELSAKLARTIIRAMRSVLEIMVLSSSLFLLAFAYLARNFHFGPKKRPPLSAQSLFASM
jgi:hypothetical protein